MDTPDEKEFDDLTKVAAYLCGVKSAQINFLDYDRQWSKSCYGWDVQEIPRDESVCTYTIQQDKYLVINDLRKAPRFKEYDFVKDEDLLFYAGVNLTSSRGYNIGTLCVFDDEPGDLTDEQLESLQVLASDVESKLELRLKREQLIEEHKKLQKTATFLHNSADIMLIVDSDTLEIEEVNEEVEKVIGYRSNEIEGTLLTDYINKEDFRNQLSDWAFQGAEERFIYETTFESRGDHRLWFEISVTENDGKYYVTGRDITDRKKAEQDLHKQKLLTEDIIRHLPGIFFLIDEEGKIIKWNNNLEGINKRKEENVISELYHNFIFGESRDAAEQALGEVFQTGYSRTEINFVSKDGQKIPLLLSGFRYRLDDYNYVIGIGIDVTEEKKALKELEDKEEKLKEAQRIASLGSWNWNISEDKLVWSDQVYDILGLNKEEVDPTVDMLLGMMPEDDRQELVQIIEGLKTNREIIDFEHQVQKNDGTEIYVHERGKVNRDKEGNSVEVSGTIQDITERKKAEEKIKAALKEKEVLLAEVHHRVKNNLAVINSMLQLEIFNTENRELVNILSNSQMRIKSMALIHEMLYSSGDFANISFKNYLGELMESILDTITFDPDEIELEMETEELNLTINQSIPCGLIANELITNAIKHAFPNGKSGKVRFKMTEKEGVIHLVVADNGVGVEGDIDFSSPDTLGLTLVNTLKDQLNGQLQVNRENGTHIHIIFPKDDSKGSSANIYLQQDG
nr:PAS domain S-box protein [Fodinibius halophilus]